MATTPTMGPAEIVTDQYLRSRTYADAIQDQVASMMDTLAAATVTVPALDVVFDTSEIAEPVIPDTGPVPTLTAHTPQTVPLPSEEVPGIDDVTVDMPQFTATMPTLNFGVAPEIAIGAVPTLPAIRDVALPAAPEVELPALPSMLSLNTPTFAGMDSHTDWLERLKNAPTLDLVRPAALVYQRGPAYTSQLLDNLKAVLNERIQGGTGLSPEVEALIWGRAVDRESRLALDAELDVVRAGEALGFKLPQGVVVAQLERARREFRDKIAGLSRDVAIKQAELEQSNLQQVVAEGVQLEAKLMDNALQIEQQAFEAARAMADSHLQIYNAGVREFEVLMQQFNTFAGVYRTLIDAETAKLQQYQAELQAEQTKAQINQSLVAQFKAQVEAQQIRVEMYRTQLQGAQTLMQVEQTKLQAAGEQVRAFVATVNAETARLDAYKTQVGAEATKVEVFKSQAQAFAAESSAKAEVAKIAITALETKARILASRYDGYRARVQSEASFSEIAANNSRVQLDAFRASNAAVEAKAGMTAKIWEAKLQQYRAGIEVTANIQRSNAAFAMQAAQMNQDVVKVGTQTAAQLLASAWNVVSTNASTSGSASESHNYSYEGT
ncbi:hypothetical protein [Comamonas aquatica]|uniref:hypothetical protein n=1 Tax=Comamonas aquatica TaxID=225991 RepID=UPI003919541D